MPDRKALKKLLLAIDSESGTSNINGHTIIREQDSYRFTAAKDSAVIHTLEEAIRRLLGANGV